METLKADLATLNDIVSRLTQDLKNTIESETDDFNAATIEKLKGSCSFAQLSDGAKKRISALLPEVPPELHSTWKWGTDDEERSDDDIVKREESSVNGDVEGDDDGGGLKREEKEDGEGEDEEGGSSFSGNKSGKGPTPLKTSMRRVTPRRSTVSVKPPNWNEHSNSASRSAEILDGKLATAANSMNFKEQAMAIWRAINQHKFAVVFRRPVNPKDAPGYIKVVKEPMDLSLIKTKIETGKVRHLDELGRLLDLMCENAMKYNGRGDDYYAYAKEIKAHSRAAVRAVKNTAAQVVQSPNYTRSTSKRKRTETSEGEEEPKEMQVDGDDQGPTTIRRKRAEATAATTTQPSRLLERRRRRK